MLAKSIRDNSPLQEKRVLRWRCTHFSDKLVEGNYPLCLYFEVSMYVIKCVHDARFKAGIVGFMGLTLKGRAWTLPLSLQGEYMVLTLRVLIPKLRAIRKIYAIAPIINLSFFKAWTLFTHYGFFSSIHTPFPYNLSSFYSKHCVNTDSKIKKI